MPKIKGVGNGKHSGTKREHFGTILKVHTGICGRLLTRGFVHPEYIYIDLNAGTGMQGEEEGSALSFLNIVPSPYQAYFIEKDEKRFHELEENITRWNKRRYSESVITALGDNREYIPLIAKHIERQYQEDWDRHRLHGLVFSDDNGTAIPFEELANFFAVPCMRTIDVLIYVSATNWKRAKGAYTEKNMQRLSDNIKSIGKTSWQVRQPQGASQWCFLFGCNWNGYPQLKKQGFHDISSREGQAILQKISYTSPELELMEKVEYEEKYKQLPLFK